MSFQYTSGDPTHLTGGSNASMADIQGPFTDLKTFINARIAAIPTLVSALPGAPVDGQEIYFQADAANGVIWHLRYRSASGSAYKWEFVGGAAMLSEVAASEATSSATYAALTTAGPTITLPLAGDYRLVQGALITTTAAAGGTCFMSYDVGATPAVDADSVELSSTITGGDRIIGTPAFGRLKTIAAASTAITSKYKTSSGSGTFARRYLHVFPVRVG